MGKLNPGGPSPASAVERITNIPILVAQIKAHSVTPFGIPVQWSRDRSLEPAFLGVPADQRSDVDGRPAKIEIGRIDGLVGNTAERGKERLPYVVAQPVALLQIQDDIEPPVRAGCQSKSWIWKNL